MLFSFVYIIILILAIFTQQTSSEDVDGTIACKDCKGKENKCVGRTIDDSQCSACANGQTFWPCNLVKECWCWDTTGPRDPGDEVDGSIACGGCGRNSDTEVCVGNMNSLTPVSDEDCSNCMEGQSFWPCTDQDLCWCWDTTKPKKPPAPISGYPVNNDIDDPCSIFTEELFNIYAPNSTFPYTYEGLCDAINDYNTHHTEKIFKMGTETQIRHEIAGFLGNTAHESDEFKAGREYLACGDRKEVDGKVYCKPCTNDLYDWINNECSVSMVDQNAPYNSYCNQVFEPPEGCICDTITQVEEEGPLAGYVEASKVFYGRGAIQLSWNYNYIRASYALTGAAETFCDDPEKVAANPIYAWGTAIFFWMERQKEGTTCHKEALNKDFGGTLNVINGGLECPAYKGGWHHDAIKMRINRYCHAAVLLGLEKLSSFSGCKGLTDSFEECLGDGWCPYCERYAGIPTEESGSSLSDFDKEEVGPSEPETDGIDPFINTEEEAAKIPDNTDASDEDEATTTAPTPSPSLSREKTSAPTQSAVENATTNSPTALFLKTKVPTKEPSTEYPTLPPIIETDAPTLKPSLSPVTNEPSSSPVTNSPTGEPTPYQEIPTYMPTTPAPTMGPCSGEPCPDGLCRSAWGFCGDGEGYCNESAVWTSSCPTVTAPPSPSPTMLDVPAPTDPPIGTSTLNDVFGTTSDEPDTESPTPEPTNMPTESKVSAGPKPTGGKPKPTGGKPVQSPPPTTSPTPLPTDLSSYASPPPTQQPTKKPVQEDTILSYPENTYFCGIDWKDANVICLIRCPSSKSEECPEGQSCFAFTTCSPAEDEVTDDEGDSQINGSDEAGSDGGEPTRQPTDVSTTSAPTRGTSTPPQEGCNGAPCPFENECRSEFGFCGTSFIYCNDLSSWKLESCGLLGQDSSGETHLCDVELFECSNGKAVHRNPADKCEFFQCPTDEEESEIFPSIFDVPGPSPLVALPKPTLPTITKPTEASSSAFLPLGEPSYSITDESPSSDSNNNLAILLGNNQNEDEVADDKDEVAKVDADESESDSKSDGANKQPVSPSYDFGMFEAEEWLKSSAHHCRRMLACQLMTSLSIVLSLLVFY